ncbi:MAG: NAD(P)/FAD-dependent oxidoreductase [Acidimicrobiales bacterium]
MADSLWDDIAAPGPETTTLCERIVTEVCVIGLGGTGLAALKELVCRGVDAVGLDEVGVAGGAAGRNGGFLLAGLAAFHHNAVSRHGRARAVSCYRETEQALAEMVAETPSAIVRNGSLRIASGVEELADCQLQLASMRADGLPVEPWSGQEGEEGLYFPGDASLQPAERCRELARHCTAGGARLFGQTPVVHVEPGKVRCLGGEVRCQAVLVCVDGRLDILLPALASSVRSARLQMLATAATPSVIAARPVYRRYGYDYYQQLPGGQLVVGGARDVGGDAEWTVAAETSAPVQGALDRLCVETIGVDLAVTHRWAGVVGYTRSGLPLVREYAPGLFVAGGYCGTGNVIGRIAGRALVELALDGHSKAAQLFDGPDGR